MMMMLMSLLECPFPVHEIAIVDATVHVDNVVFIDSSIEEVTHLVQNDLTFFEFLFIYHDW